jgi:gliding motility-associated-like protein
MKINLDRRILFLLTFLFFSFSMSATTYYADAVNGSDTNNGMFQNYVSGMDGPTQTISAAIQIAAPGDTIFVAEGTYLETLTIDKELVLYGNNYNIPSSGTRNPESIIHPDHVDFAGPPNVNNSMAIITGDLVQVLGFYFDGDNRNEMSGNIVDTSDVDIAYGIIAMKQQDLLQIGNNIFTNVNTSAILFKGSMGLANIPAIIDNCDFWNFNSASRTIDCSDDFYANVTNCRIWKTDDGIVLHDYSSAGTPSILRFRQNEISCKASGLTIENFGTQQISVGINENIFKSDAGYKADAGVVLINITDSADIKTNSNQFLTVSKGIDIVDGYALPFYSTLDSFSNTSTAYSVLNTTNTKPLTEVFLIKPFMDAFIFNGIIIESKANKIELSVSDAEIKNGKDAVLVRGDCEPDLQNIAFSNVSGNYVELAKNANGDAPTKNFNISNSSFDGVAGLTLNKSQGRAVEDKLIHYMDTSDFAVISFNANNIYVTTHDGNTSLGRGLKIAFDNWNIYVDSMHNMEDVIVENTINLYPLSNLSIGSVTMNQLGKELILHDDLSLATGLNLTAGNVNTSNGDLYVGRMGIAAAPMGITGGSVTSYVDGDLYIVNDDGKRDTLYFPIGLNGDYRPCTMQVLFNNGNDTSLFKGSMVDAKPVSLPVDSTLSHVSDIRYWDMSYSGTSTINSVFYTVDYSTSLSDDGVVDAANLRLAGDNGAKWEDLGGTGSANSAGTISSTIGMDKVASITLANASEGTNFMGIDRSIAGFDNNGTCVFSPTAFFDGSISNGGFIVSWAWDFGVKDSTNDTAVIANPLYTYQSPGVYTVQLMVTNANGGSSTIKKDVLITPLPQADFDVLVPCFPNRMQMTNTSSISMGTIDQNKWTVDTFVYSAKDIQPTLLDTGTYSIELIVTSDNGCKDTTSQTVFYGDSVRIAFDQIGPISKCDYNNVDIGLNKTYTSYLWSTGDTVAKITVSAAGHYVLRAQTSRNCFGTDSIEVINIPRPLVDAGPDKTVSYGDQVQLSGTGQGTLTWLPITYLNDPNIAQPTGRPFESIQYTITAMNAGGCVNSDSMMVSVVVPEVIRVNNMITPNNDGKNDVWKLDNVPGLDEAVVVVMSRWGQEVFRQDNYQNDWDGTNDLGEPLPEGTYIFIIEITGLNAKIYKGNLEIIR